MVSSNMVRTCLEGVEVENVKRERIRGANMYVWVIVRETAKKTFLWQIPQRVKSRNSVKGSFWSPDFHD